MRPKREVKDAMVEITAAPKPNSKDDKSLEATREVKDAMVEITAAPKANSKANNSLEAIPSVMSWFYLTPAPIDNNAWKDAMDGNINVSKLENRFKYEADEARFEMMKNIPEFKRNKVPALKMEFGKYCESYHCYIIIAAQFVFLEILLGC